jgi:hypothetical protein
MTVAIVYGEQSGIVRRFVHVTAVLDGEGRPDIVATVGQLAGHYAPGESIIILDDEEIIVLTAQGRVPDLPYAQQLVAEKRGKIADGNRCLVINNDTAEIEGVIPADPIIDSLPNKTLYQHETANPGWEVDETGEFAAPVIDQPTDDGEGG